jgi:hypothetical protein
MRAALLASVVFAAGLSASTPCYATTANELLVSCEAMLRTPQQSDEQIAVPPSARPCWHYLSAVQDLSVYRENNNMLLGVCPPPESSLTQYIRIFVEYARKHPATLHENASYIATLALREAFPCR